MRGEKLFKNTVIGVISQGVAALTGTIVHLVFIRFMIKEYLGAKSLFSNILDFLSLAELGIGLVLVYSMYQPLAEKNERKLIALTQFYRKAYNLIAAMVFCSGMCLMPFLSFFIENMEKVPHAQLIFFLYLVSSASSYFFVYKQSILNADQRIYITHLFSIVFSIIQCVLQIVVLVSGSPYRFFYYLIVQTVMVVCKNYMLTKKAEKLYPFLCSKEKILLTKDEKKAIYKNVFAMFNHRVGAVVLGSTDNLLISKFIGIIYCGFYGNFKMIVNLMNSFIGQFFNAMLSSVGNMTALESKETVYKTFKYLHFLSFWMYTFCTVAFIELANPVLMQVLALMGVEDVQSYGFTFPGGHQCCGFHCRYTENGNCRYLLRNDFQHGRHLALGGTAGALPSRIKTLHGRILGEGIRVSHLLRRDDCADAFCGYPACGQHAPTHRMG